MTENNLATAIAAVQASLPRISKGETAQVRSDKGNYSYKYADLADVSHAVLPVLGAHGLAFIAKPTITEGGQFALSYSLLHVSGEREDGIYPLPANGTPQAIGSAITYARRYCLCAVTGTAPAEDDDDGAAANTSQQYARQSSAGEAFASAAPARQGNGRTSIKAEDIPPPDDHPAPVVAPADAITDIDWMSTVVDDLVPAATTRKELAGLWAGVTEHVKAGQCTDEHGRQIQSMITARSAELGFSKAAA